MENLQDIIDKRNTPDRYSEAKKRYDYSEQDIKDIVSEFLALPTVQDVVDFTHKKTGIRETRDFLDGATYALSFLKLKA